jgi:hypothetical protein
MKPRDEVLARVRDPIGREVVLLARIWHDKILRRHYEMGRHLQDLLITVARPDHDEPDRLAGRWRYYRRHLGPSRWLFVVVSYEQAPGRIVSALGVRKDPHEWKG